MHERTRRRICRALFFALCVIPTAVVCAAIVYRSTPHYAARQRRAWQQAVYDQLGLEARIQRVASAARGVTLLHGVQLHDPDGGRLLARLRLVECTVAPGQMRVVAAQPQIDAAQFARLLDILHQRVLRGGGPSRPWRLEAGEVTLAGPDDAQTLTGVQCSVQKRSGQVEVAMRFGMAGAALDEPARLHITRRRDGDRAVTAWQLRTGPTPLPCAPAAAFLPPLSALGNAARFAGEVSAELSAGGWSGQLAGRFTDVDLARLVEPFPHKASGTADITLDSALFRDSRLQQAGGQFESGAGVVSRSLLQSLAAALELPTTLPDAAGDAPPLLTYHCCSFRFQMADAALTVAGTCPETPGAVVSGRDGALLGESAGPVPVIGLARALVPARELHVPATRQTALLLRWLPLPAAEAPAETARQPYAPLRLRR